MSSSRRYLVAMLTAFLPALSGCFIFDCTVKGEIEEEAPPVEVEKDTHEA